MSSRPSPSHVSLPGRCVAVYPLSMRRFVVILLLALCGIGRADFVEVVASKDTTIYSDPTTTPLSNGAGQYLFVGRTGENNSFNLRRAIVQFDVGSFIPAGSVVTSATLRLYVNRRPPSLNPTDPITAYRALADWGEGTSAPLGAGGSGAAATPNDATWFHTFYSSQFWTTPGGDFAASASATAELDDVGAYFMEGAGLVADIQFWLNTPAQNYGLFLLGDEVNTQTARRLISMNLNDPDTAPTFLIGYTVVPEPGLAGLLAAGAATLAVLRLNGASARRRRG